MNQNANKDGVASRFSHLNNKDHKPTIHQLLIKQTAYVDQEKHGWVRPSLCLCLPLEMVVVAYGRVVLGGGLG